MHPGNTMSKPKINSFKYVFISICIAIVLKLNKNNIIITII